jgi:pyrimidine-nucleoside phosphorylase
VVDKHSTGGIGDKVSLPLAPLLACLGLRVPMISGRALGITGGTLDKLESIPGFRTQLSRDEIQRQVDRIGVALAGQTTAMCPADRFLYALRDASGTVPSVPLIAASILSKKLAEGISALVMDVKFGAGAFMRTRDQARELATTMISIANESGVATRALLTDMNSPLGRAAGNWLEVKESIDCLENRGPQDLQLLVVECAAHLLMLTDSASDLRSARARASDVLVSGAPRRKWDELVIAQGGDLVAFESRLTADHISPEVVVLRSKTAGYLARSDARILGEVIRDIGGGRLTREFAIDPDVGMDQIAGIGDRIERESTLCRIHARTREQGLAAVAQAEAAFDISPVPVPPRQLVVETL